MSEAQTPSVDTPEKIEVSREICGVHDWTYCDDGPDGASRVHVYGTCHKPPGHPTNRHAEPYRLPDGNVGLWAEWGGYRGSPDDLPATPRCEHARPGDPIYLDEQSRVIESETSDCPNTFKTEPCVLGKDHGGSVHLDQHGTPWGTHRRYDPLNGGYEVEAPAEHTLNLSVRPGSYSGPTIGGITRGLDHATQYENDVRALNHLLDRMGREVKYPFEVQECAAFILDSNWFKWASGQIGCCTNCKGSGFDGEGACTDCLATGHAHGADDHCRMPWVRA